MSYPAGGTEGDTVGETAGRVGGMRGEAGRAGAPGRPGGRVDPLLSGRGLLPPVGKTQ